MFEYDFIDDLHLKMLIGGVSGHAKKLNIKNMFIVLIFLKVVSTFVLQLKKHVLNLLVFLMTFHCNKTNVWR